MFADAHQNLAKSSPVRGSGRLSAARVHALRGVIRLPKDFDERKFKAERLLNRQSNFARFAGRWTAEEAVAFNELTLRTVDEEEWK